MPPPQQQHKSRLVKEIQKCPSFSNITSLQMFGDKKQKAISKGLAAAGAVPASVRASIYSSWIRGRFLFVDDTAAISMMKTFSAYIVDNGLSYGDAVSIWERSAWSDEHETPELGTQASRVLSQRLYLLRHELLRAYSGDVIGDDRAKLRREEIEERKGAQSGSNEEGEINDDLPSHGGQRTLERSNGPHGYRVRTMGDTHSASQPTGRNLKRKSAMIDLTDDAPDASMVGSSDQSLQKSYACYESNSKDLEVKKRSDQDYALADQGLYSDEMNQGANNHVKHDSNLPREDVRTDQIQKHIPDKRRAVEYLGKKFKSTHDSNNGEDSHNYQVHMYETSKKSTKPDLTRRSSPSEGRLTPWSETSSEKSPENSYHTPQVLQRPTKPGDLFGGRPASLRTDTFLYGLEQDMNERAEAKANPIIVDDSSSSDDLEDFQDQEPGLDIDKPVEGNAAQFWFHAGADGRDQLSNTDNSIPA